MIFYADVEDGSGNRLGPGPITTLIDWSVARRADRAGEFSLRMVASDVMASFVTAKRVIKIYALLDTWTYMGGGIIDQVRKMPQSDGTVLIQVAGGDILRELTYKILQGVEVTGNGASMLTQLGIVAPTWTFVADPSWGGSSPYFYMIFDGETILTTVFNLAAKAGSHAFLSDDREISFLSTPTASGVRAIQAQGLLSSPNCAIVELEELSDSFDLATVILPYGAGQGATQLTMAATSRTAPAGYTLDAANNTLKHDAAYSTYGEIQRRVEFKDVAPISNTDLDLENAANALYDSAKVWLDYHVQPQKSYRLKVAQCPQVLYPMQSIRVVYRGQNLTLNDDLVILEATVAGDANGLRTTDLVVSDVSNWPADDASVVVDAGQQSSVFLAHQQLNANTYTTGYNKLVDDTYNATFRFRFGSEVTQVQQVLFEFQILPLESTVKTIGGSASGSVDIPDHTHTVNVPNHTHTVSVSAHTHTVDVPSHHHDLDIDSDATTHGFARIMYFDPTSNLLYYDQSGGSASTFTSNNGGGSTVTSSSGGSSTPTSSSGGASTVTSSSGGGSTGLTVDISSALTAEYGIFREDAGNTFAITDLEYSVNGGSWADLSGATSLGSSWYQLDITSLVQNSTTFRPLQESNTLDIRKKSGAASKTASIDALLSVRNIIQTIAYS